MEASTVLVREIATTRSASKFSAASHRRVHGCMLLCEIRASRAALRRRPVAMCRTAWLRAGIRLQRWPGNRCGTGGNGSAPAAGGTCLSKACPMLEPFKRASRRVPCLIFDLELFDIGRLGLCGLDPFLHLGHRHDGPGVGGKLGIEL